MKSLALHHQSFLNNLFEKGELRGKLSEREIWIDLESLTSFLTLSPGKTDMLQKETCCIMVVRIRVEKEVYWEGHVHTAIFKMDNQQGPVV